ncbi:MAG: hypothetical protein HQL53_01995 [Magnetococcales bacterium]|nr:hypothetical protein [Magnetococcales bacterium]
MTPLYRKRLKMPNIIVGLIALALGLWGLSVWWWSVVEMLRGLVPILLIIFSFIALGAGISNMREHEDEDESEPNELMEFAEAKQKEE